MKQPGPTGTDKSMVAELLTNTNFSVGNTMDLVDADMVQSRVSTLKGQK
jgi:hypothetical protein